MLLHFKHTTRPIRLIMYHMKARKNRDRMKRDIKELSIREKEETYSQPEINTLFPRTSIISLESL